jgi:hypothetical protein
MLNVNETQCGRNFKPRMTVANLSNLPSILNNFDFQKDKRVSIHNNETQTNNDKVSTQNKNVQFDTPKITINQVEKTIPPKHRQSDKLLPCAFLKLQEMSPKSSFPSSKKLLIRRRMTEKIEKLIDSSLKLPHVEPVKKQNKLVNLHDLILPSLSDKLDKHDKLKQDSYRGLLSLGEMATAETEPNINKNFLVPISKPTNSDIKKYKFGSFCKPLKQKVVEQTVYKPNSTVYFKNKKIRDMKVLVNKQYSKYLVKCNELTDFLETRCETFASIKFE